MLSRAPGASGRVFAAVVLAESAAVNGRVLRSVPVV